MQYINTFVHLPTANHQTATANHHPPMANDETPMANDETPMANEENSPKACGLVLMIYSIYNKRQQFYTTGILLK